MKKLIVMTFVWLALFPVAASAEIVVVASKSTQVSAASLNDIKRIFSGTQSSLAGVDVVPVDLSKGSPTRERFYKEVMGRTPAQMESYWARMTFTGQGNPPREVAGPQELRSLMLSPGSRYIGYLERGDVSANMTVLFALD